MKVFLVPNYYKQEAVESGLMLELWLTRQGYEGRMGCRPAIEDSEHA